MRDWKSKIYNQGMLLKYQAADFCIITLKWLLCLLFGGLLGMNLLCFSNLVNNYESVEYIIEISFLYNILFIVVIIISQQASYNKVLESFGIIPSTQSCISPPTLCLLNDCALIKAKPASSLGKGMGPVSLVVILQKLICDGSQEGYGIQARR